VIWDGSKGGEFYKRRRGEEDEIGRFLKEE
jgi:hypothetical protein